MNSGIIAVGAAAAAHSVSCPPIGVALSDKRIPLIATVSAASSKQFLRLRYSTSSSAVVERLLDASSVSVSS